MLLLTNGGVFFLKDDAKTTLLVLWKYKHVMYMLLYVLTYIIKLSDNENFARIFILAETLRPLTLKDTKMR